ncbi:putative transcriptional regulator [Pseudoalteromonas ulvae UL12]|uniref:ChrR family anti-sigma-E factor n=1 Tax=Pseudoalteromonas ulvae TaxID=107327 RepID=UPI00186B76A4|nr:ChrR family anti-sigma-E factor [Pseudoalteromonas ulvae]MBE0366133.1 putative transcriptional regulator [Pseudoalteromonas ulvae UL12]
MITFHPEHDLLCQFVAAELPASLSAAISMHAELCPKCAKEIEQLTFLASEQFSQVDTQEDTSISQTDYSDLNIDDMINAICSDIATDTPVVSELPQVEIKGQVYSLPRALRSTSMSGWYKMGKLSRARIDLNEGALHASLLHIDKEGSVPQHTHKGFELTLLLEGSFKDEMGTYVKGDFIMLDGEHTHNPITEKGCLCFTVADDALHFTQGFSKLLNPLGSFIY